MIIKNTKFVNQSYVFVNNCFYKQYCKFLQQILCLVINKSLLLEVLI